MTGASASLTVKKATTSFHSVKRSAARSNCAAVNVGSSFNFVNAFSAYLNTKTASNYPTVSRYKNEKDRKMKRIAVLFH